LCFWVSGISIIEAGEVVISPGEMKILFTFLALVAGILMMIIIGLLFSRPKKTGSKYRIDSDPDGR